MTQLTIAHLLREHREIECAFAALRSLVQGETFPSSWTPELSRTFAAFALAFADCVIPHIQKEEEILFPALEGFLPRDLGPLAVLRGEHHDVRQQFEQMRSASAILDSGGTNASALKVFMENVHAISDLMRDHIYKEDRILFPLVTRFLSGVRDAYLVRQMEALQETPNGSSKVKSRP
jgi:iron-sulfur cluster repair protein YtfE (RIC family)